MKIITQIFILFTALLLLPSVLFGQTKAIMSEDYYSAIKEAESKTDKQIRKRVQVQKLYTNGKVTTTLTDITESIPPDKSRWISVENKGDVVKKIERITIGNIIYRKEGDGAWTKGEKNSGFYGIGGKDNSTREFFIEERTAGKEKFQVLTVKTVNYDNTFFDESKTWINSKGRILKMNITTSRTELKNIVSTVDITYDYKLKAPKIEAPIK